MKKLFLALSLFSLFSLAAIHFVRAEDDEGDDEYERASNTSQVTTSSPSETKTKQITQTIIVEPAKIVTENVMQNVDLPDSDKDGIPDSEDPHPNIAEIYVVEDNNFNGIDDKLERSFVQQ